MRWRQLLFLGSIYLLGALLLAAIVFCVLKPNVVLTLVNPLGIEDGHLSSNVMRLYADVFGLEKMYATYATAIEKMPVGPQHRAGHILGEVLYEREGMKALDRCGQRFTGACVHQIASQYVAALGTDSATEIISKCTTQTGALLGTCAHAVGHGLTYMSKYDPSKLEENLNMCDTLDIKPVDPVQSCYAGVFMEYNMRYVEYEYPNPRTVEGDPLTTCEGLSSQLHKRMCVFWTIPWLHAAQYNFAFSSEIISELGNICARVTDTEQRRDCFYSIGRTLTISNIMLPKVANDYCESIGKTHEDINACIWWAARAYFQAGGENRTNELCKMRSDDDVRACVEFAIEPMATP